MMRRRTFSSGLAVSTLVAVGLVGGSDAVAAYDTSYAKAHALHGDFNGDGYGDLVAASANASFTGADRAGAIQVVFGGANGLRKNTAKRFTQDTRGVPDTRETGDMWGTAIAVGDFDGNGYSDLAVGAPGETLGTHAGAGMVTVLYGSANGLTGSGAKALTQNTRGVPNRAESGDRFGTSLAVGDFNGDRRDDLAVGVPGEKLRNSTKRRGMVEVFAGSRSGITTTNVGVFTSKRAGMRDDAHTSGGTWGGYLAAGDFDHDGHFDLALTNANAKVDGVVMGYLQVLYGTGSGLGAARAHRWSAASPGLAGRYFNGPVVSGHFDGDTYGDLVVGSRPPGPQGFTVLYGTANGIRSARNAFMEPAGAGQTAVPLAAGNLIGTLQDDLVWSGGQATTESATFGVIPGSDTGLTMDGSQTFDYAAGPASPTGDLYRAVTAAAVLKPQGRSEPPTLAVTDGPIEPGDQVASNSIYLYTASAHTLPQDPTDELTSANTGFNKSVYATALA